METPQTDSLFEHPVLDAMAVELSREYTKMLAGMNASIAAVLKRAHGMTKSEGLYVIEGGLGREEDLFKAKKPAAPAQSRKKMSEAEAKEKRKEGVKAPGSRGGKWWRDSKGHVRYGEKPAEDDRDWKPLDEEEVSKLHESLEAVYGYSPVVRDSLRDVMRARGFNSDMLLQCFRDANSYDMEVGDYWRQLAEWSGKSPKDADEALSAVMEAYRSSLADEKVKKAAKQAIQRRKLAEQHAGEQVKRSTEYTDGFAEKFLTGNTKEEAMRLMGLLSDMELLHIPHTLNDAKEFFESKDEARASVGNIVPNQLRLQALYPRLNDLNDEQLMAVYLAQMFRDMREGGVAFKNLRDGDNLGEVERYFKDGATYVDSLLPEGDYNIKDDAERLAAMNEVERANFSLNQLMAARFDWEDRDSPKVAKQIARMRELAHEVHQYVNAFNTDAGGQELGLIFTNQVAPESLFKDEDALQELQAKVEAKQKVVRDALAAQKDEDFATPQGVRAGFKAMGEGKDLLSYQRQALNWMSAVKRGILAYDTGMGKTPMSISMIAHLQDLVKQGKLAKEDARGVMVMPLGLTRQWPNEIRKFFPDAKIVTIGEDIESAEDRIKVLSAIQSGELEADFVILSSSVVNFHSDTREAWKSSELFEESDNGEMKPKKGVSGDEVVAAMRDAAAADPLCSALRGLRGCVFFDEAHHEQQGLKKPLNIRNAAAREFLKDREHSFLLTATPMPNGQPEELYELLDIIHPGAAGPSSKRFRNKMMTTELDENGVEVEVAADNWGKVAQDIAPYCFRKNKLDDDVLAANKAAGMELGNLVGDEGEKGGATHGIAMPGSFKRLFETAGDIKPHDFEAVNKDRKDAKGNPIKWKTLEELGPGGQLRALSQQQQLSISPRLLLGDDPAEWKKHGYDGSQPKIDHLAEMVKAHFNNPHNHDKPMVVFSQWPGAFKYAKEKLIAEGMDPSLIGEIHGDIKPGDRAAYQEATNAGKIKVLFVGTQAGGAGLNLQKKARKMVFLDQPFMLAHKLQALGRVWRTGNPDDVEVINMYMKGTYDAKKVAGLAEKGTTDALMSSSNEAIRTNRIQNALLMAVGGDPKAVLDIENMRDADLAHRLESKGLKNVATPSLLKQKFDKVPFAQTMEFKAHLDDGRSSIETQRMLNNLKLKTGDIDKDEHGRRARRLARAEKELVRQSRILGKQMALPDDVKSVLEPEPTYVMSPNAGKAKTAKLSPVAQAIMAVAKKTKDGLTASDFVDDHLKQEVEKEIERDKAGKPKDVTAHYASVKKWYDSKGDIEKLVNEGITELMREGVLSQASATHAPKASETKLPQKAPASAKAPAAPKAPAPTEVEAPSVNYAGGWKLNTTIPADKMKVAKKVELDIGQNQQVSMVELVGAMKGSRGLKSFESFKTWMEGMIDRKMTDAAVKKIIKTLHEHGVMS